MNAKPFQLPRYASRLGAALAALVLAGCGATAATVPDLPSAAASSPEQETVATVPSPPPSPDELLARGRASLASGDSQGAIAPLEAAVELRPEDVQARLDLTKALELSNAPGKAVSQAIAACGLPLQGGQPAQALLHLVRKHGEGIKDAEDCIARTLEGSARGEFELDASLRRELMTGLGGIRLESGDIPAAESIMRHLVEEAPEDGIPLAFLALAAHLQGRSAEAGHLSARALALSTDNDFALYVRAKVLAGKDDAGAAAHLRRSLEANPCQPDAMALLGALALEYRDYATALETFQRLEALRPAYPRIDLFMAWALEGAKGPDGTARVREAVGRLGKALEKDPGDVDALLTLAGIRSGAGDKGVRNLDAASALYEKALAAMPSDDARRAGAEESLQRIRGMIAAENQLKSSAEEGASTP